MKLLLKDHRMHLSEDVYKSKTVIPGFTLIELMITVAAVAILAAKAIPSTLTYHQHSEIAEVLRMADNIREDVTDYYSKYLSFPSNNSEAGAPEPNLLIANRVTKIEIEDGAIHITPGNKVSKPLQNKMLSLRPAIVTGSPTSQFHGFVDRINPFQEWKQSLTIKPT